MTKQMSEKNNFLEFKDQIISNELHTIDTIRFLAMCSVVWGHCNMGLETNTYSETYDIIARSVILQIGKIGTILFFLISGYLMGPKIHQYTIRGFLKTRLSSTVLPWFLSLSVFCLLTLINEPHFAGALGNGDLKQASLMISMIFKNSVFHFAYWFIIVFLISSVLLVSLKKYVLKPWLGMLLAAITLFYCVNLHYAWISTYHTKAFLGYAFFMWLGVQLKANHKRSIAFLENTSWGLLIAAFILSFIFSCAEGIILSKGNCADPYASIRISNIINSLISFACLFKLGKIKMIGKLEPRKNAYRIYLLHSILIYVVTILYYNYLPQAHINPSISRLFLVEILVFALILSSSQLLASKMRMSHIKHYQEKLIYLMAIIYEKLNHQLLIIRNFSLSYKFHSLTNAIRLRKAITRVLIPIVSLLYVGR